tara:strand:- start:367 stop:882 length:516 start_codon:yes stop_codon:yes gene_type:complete
VAEQAKEVQDLLQDSQTSVQLAEAVEKVILKTVFLEVLEEEREAHKGTIPQTLEDQQHQEKEMSAETLVHFLALEQAAEVEVQLTQAKMHLETLEHLEEQELQSTSQDQVRLGVVAADHLKVALDQTGQEDLEAAVPEVHQVKRVSQIVAAAEAAAENRFKVDRAALVLSI